MPTLAPRLVAWRLMRGMMALASAFALLLAFPATGFAAEAPAKPSQASRFRCAGPGRAGGSNR